MAPQFDRALRDLLRAAGCTFVRQGRGSHEIWYSPISDHRFPVDGKIKSRHWANIVLKQAGLSLSSTSRRQQNLRDGILLTLLALPRPTTSILTKNTC